jgi:molecular chaperone GrpE
MTKDDKKLKEEIADLTNKWKRALADYQNLEKRVSLEKEDFVRFANADLILKILPALDNLERAEEHLKDEGLGLALKQLRQALTEAGLEKIEVTGKEFDPEIMECCELVQGEEEKIIEETRSGYKLNDKLLRCAQVKVGKKMQGEK